MSDQEAGPGEGDVERTSGAARQRHPRALLVFVVGFAACLLVGSFLMALPQVEAGLIEPWARANVVAAAWLSRLIGLDARASGTNLSAGAASLSVRNGCDGVHAMLILAGAILAFPAPLPRKALGLVLGAIVVFGFNIVRLVNLLFVAVHSPARLEFFHIYVWQILIGLLAFGTFLAWGTFLARRR